MDVDLSELDDWLGTLEELQLGLELCHSVTGARRTDVSSSTAAPDSGIPLSSASCVNRTFAHGPTTTHYPSSAPRAPMAHINPAAQESVSSYENAPHTLAESHRDPTGTSGMNGAEMQGLHVDDHTRLTEKFPSMGTVGRNQKEATAERDLSSLLQELEVVEERMKELESENTTFTRRYSLASSPHAKRPSDHQFDSTDFTSATAGIPPNSSQPSSKSHLAVAPSASTGSTTKSTTNGFVSAQWAAQLNPDLSTLDREQSCSPPPPPPAFLGAGDACVSPPTSPQPPTPSIALLQQTEAGIWSMNPQNMTTRDPMVNPMPKSILAKPTSGMKSTQSNGTVSLSGGRNASSGLLISSKPMMNHLETEPIGPTQLSQTPQPSTQATTYAYSGVRAVDVTHANNLSQRLGLSDSATSPTVTAMNASNVTLPSSVTTGDCTRSAPTHMEMHYSSTGALNASRVLGSHRPPLSSNSSHINTRPNDGDDESSLSGMGSWSPGQPVPRRDLIKTNSIVGHGGSDGLSNSLSPESSLSDKSFSESTELGHRNVAQSSNSIEGQMKKLVVRIFRPDRTTKAILIEEHMTAGEVASMMIEKNFLQPSTRLAVVEKVPALKVERVFEEHEKVVDCILSWPTRSQNMIFFEERDDLFGLIESPSEWLGEEFVKKHRYASSTVMQMMLDTIEQAGFPEWRDYLYIRKPGEKTWSRRLCVLRSSGLYTSKKNRKSLNPTDLIRILVLDSHLQLYTTTGGWTRMKAPTPHGFAFKPYSAQDPASTHVFCFCATDEKALRNWVARLRIAKYGRQLFLDYQSARARVERQRDLRHTAVGASLGLNGSLSAGIHRKSSFDFLSTSSNPTLTTAESTTSLITTTHSPCAPKRYMSAQPQLISSELKQPGEERVSFNQFRTPSVPQQINAGMERVQVLPMSAGTHSHMGLRPQAPQGLLDSHHPHACNRGELRSATPTSSNSHFVGHAQLGLRRG